MEPMTREQFAKQLAEEGKISELAPGPVHFVDEVHLHTEEQIAAPLGDPTFANARAAAFEQRVGSFVPLNIRYGTDAERVEWLLGEISRPAELTDDRQPRWMTASAPDDLVERLSLSMANEARSWGEELGDLKARLRHISTICAVMLRDPTDELQAVVNELERCDQIAAIPALTAAQHRITELEQLAHDQGEQILHLADTETTIEQATNRALRLEGKCQAVAQAIGLERGGGPDGGDLVPAVERLVAERDELQTLLTELAPDSLIAERDAYRSALQEIELGGNGGFGPSRARRALQERVGGAQS